MYELPLFPLNLVLFPMQSLALHIFEERYKTMIQHCIDTDSPFGVVLLEQGAAEEGRSRVEAKPRLIGCTAHISQVQQLGDGRMNIIVVGRERFKIHEFLLDKPYLAGNVENLPQRGLDGAASEPLITSLKRSMTRYLKVLEEAGRIQPGTRKMPSDPQTLGSLAAVMLHDISLLQRQALLEAETLHGMFSELQTLYRREIVLLEAMLTEPGDDQIAPFSAN